MGRVRPTRSAAQAVGEALRGRPARGGRQRVVPLTPSRVYATTAAPGQDGVPGNNGASPPTRSCAHQNRQLVRRGTRPLVTAAHTWARPLRVTLGHRSFKITCTLMPPATRGPVRWLATPGDEDSRESPAEVPETRRSARTRYQAYWPRRRCPGGRPTRSDPSMGSRVGSSSKPRRSTSLRLEQPAQRVTIEVTIDYSSLLHTYTKGA